MIATGLFVVHESWFFQYKILFLIFSSKGEINEKLRELALVREALKIKWFTHNLLYFVIKKQLLFFDSRYTNLKVGNKITCFENMNNLEHTLCKNIDA